MKLYILEDEIRIMQHILQIVQRFAYLQVVGHAGEVTKAAEEIPLLKPDIILADIRLKDGDSFRLFNEIGIEDFQVIFLTAYDQYAIQALNLGAFGYLLKPIDETALGEVLDRCYQHREQEYFDRQQLEIARNHYLTQGIGGIKRIALKSLEYIEIVDTEDIMYCQSDKGYTTFYLKDSREILVSKGLKEYEAMLIPLGFLRCHQSYLINFQYVKKYYREGFLQMQNNEKIPVSNRKREELLKHLQNIS
ncbi:LytR/AlgR family response regulator transcription factor [Pedobacter punctiformis]|uniref:LytTR family DNA-binding domain-containing protein n=1 Tax=Pedobacter punctiformis TaxID=3004097 RepID=A0ABT4L6Q1_9SPHI|nr:LytTR family DNA-binding domain-containing protein [Pedobacter sp. HCMS5-2]MCZ4243590.1 LytTR family DNA-binding domain-containing protein [Pedobacter sp. HCMS5-2]